MDIFQYCPEIAVLLDQKSLVMSIRHIPFRSAYDKRNNLLHGIEHLIAGFDIQVGH